MKNIFVLGQNHFLKLQYLKDPFIKLYWNKLWQWSKVRDNFWLSLKVCICCGFCNHLWQRFLHFWGIFPYLESVIRKLLLLWLKLMHTYLSYLLMLSSTFYLWLKKEDRISNFWFSNGAVTLTRRSRSDLFSMSQVFVINYLCVKFGDIRTFQ